MSDSTLVRLTRELRFGLHEPAPEGAAGSANGFAGSPVLAEIAPFLILRATLSGEIDPATGMLVNIKQVDRVLRQRAVPEIRRLYYHEKLAAAGILRRVFEDVREAFLPHVVEKLEMGLSPFLRLSMGRKEPGMVRLTQRFEFSAAHRLHADALSAADNIEVFGRCNNLNGHGHNYELEVTVGGEPDQRTGAVMPVLELQKIVNERVLNVFDHKHLNVDCAEFAGINPTVENIAKVIHGKLKPAFGNNGVAQLVSVRVWETPKTMCEYGDVE